MFDEEAFGPAAAAVEDPVGAVGSFARGAAEGGGEEFAEGAEAGGFPGGVSAAGVEQHDGAGLAHLLEAGALERAADLEDPEGGPPDEVGGAVLQHPGRVADAPPA